MRYKGPVTQRDAPAPARASARHWLIVMGAACLMTAGMFGFLSASILNPPLAKSLGAGLSEVMVYNSLQGLAGVLSMTFIAPRLMRRIGVRATIVASGLWAALSIGAVAAAPNLGVLYVLGFSSGLTMGMATMMGASMLINTWFEARRGTMMGAVFALSGVGGILAGLVLPAVVISVGWQGGFLVVGAVMLVLVVVPGLFMIRSSPASVGLTALGVAHRPEGADDDVVVPGVPAARAFRSAQFVALAVGIVLFAMVQAVQQHFAPLMVERGVDLAVAGSLISVMALASVVSNIVVGTLNDRKGTLVAVLLALACQLIAMFGYVFSNGFVPLALSTVTFAFGAALPGVLIPILVMLMFGPRDFAAILGPAMAMMPAGMALGTPLWGIAVDLTGSYTTALLVSAVLTAVTAALLGWAIQTAPNFRSRIERELATELPATS